MTEQIRHSDKSRGPEVRALQSVVALQPTYLAEEAFSCHPVGVGKNTEVTLGSGLVVALAILAGIALYGRVLVNLAIRAGKASNTASRHFDAILAAIIAYSCYMAAALMADAEFPKFLRDHLFDGLALAFLVGLLINRFPSDRPRTAFPIIRRPFVVLLVLFMGGGLIFGLIAIAAVFSSGSNEYERPLLYCSIYGGWIFLFGYMMLAFTMSPLDSVRDGIIWYLRKRPQERTAQREADQHAQASEVIAWFGSPKLIRPASADAAVVNLEAPIDATWGGVVLNASDLPIFDVRIFYYRVNDRRDGSPWTAEQCYASVDTIRMIPPRQTRSQELPARIRKQSKERSDRLYLVGVEFTDADGRRWFRRGRDVLEPLDTRDDIPLV
jgi:hypothetical protein